MKDTYATVASKAAYYREHVGTLSNCYDDVIDVRKEDVWTQFTEEGKFLTDHIFYNNIMVRSCVGNAQPRFALRL